MTAASAPPRVRVPARLWLIILAGCVVAGALDALQTALQGTLGENGRIDWAMVVFQGSEWLFLGALTLLTFFLGQRFPVRRPHVARALLVHATGALLLCVGWATMGVVLRRGLNRGWSTSFPEELAGWTLTSVPWSFFMYFAVLGTVHAFAYYVEARDRELQATQLSGQLSETRLQALRAQLQPHFLFNTLNAITVLVRDRRGTMAVRMLDGLSDMLRQVLRTDQPHEIALRSSTMRSSRSAGAGRRIRWSFGCVTTALVLRRRSGPALVWTTRAHGWRRSMASAPPSRWATMPGVAPAHAFGCHGERYRHDPRAAGRR
jgi:hypothetical protein